MLINAEELQAGTTIESDIAIVGAGPAGIVLALELANSGYDVALLESGKLRFSEEIQSLGDAAEFDPKSHAPMSDCTRRQVGGTSNIWGGRCVPYDPIDFAQRSYIPHSSWPISYADVQPYFSKCCDYFLCGKPQFNAQDILNLKQKSIIPDLPDEHILTSSLERWSLPTNFGKEYLDQLRQSQRIKLVYGLTCTAIESDQTGAHIIGLVAKTLDNRSIKINSKQYVLTGGALNTTRLMLASNQRHPDGMGNHSGLLGKFYMGHISGDIAVAHFTTPPQQTKFGFDRDPDNIYLRHRFSFTQEFLLEKELTNIVAWLGVPKFADPSHENGILSAAYVALNSPFLGKYLTAKAIQKSLLGDQQGVYRQHLKNILNDLPNTLTFLPSFSYGRFLARRKIPALFVYSASNEYPLHYHGEQVPNPNSTVSLSDEKDELGMPKLKINLRFSQQDVDSVIKAHHYWDAHLRKHNRGYLRYLSDDPESSIWQQASDGFHQVGTTRMSNHPNTGVVDPNCKVHGINNLFVISSSNFVTSGQANSTFMIVVLGLRLVDFLRRELA